MVLAFKLLVTIALAWLFGYLLLKVGLPGGMMIGPMLAVALLQIHSDWIYVLPGSKEFAQIIAGIFVGSSLSKEDIRRLPSLWRSLLIIICGLAITNLWSGWLIARFSRLDMATSLMGTIPGGMTSIPILAVDFGANPIVVTVLQFTRMTLGIGLFPSLVHFLANHYQKHFPSKSPKLVVQTIDRKLPNSPSKVFSSTYLGVIALVGSLSLLSQHLVPSMNLMVLALIWMAFVNIHLQITSFPIWIRRLAQILSGWYIGAQFGPDQIALLGDLILPIVITGLSYLLASILLGFLVAKIQPMPLNNGLLSSIPAGASDMALIAADLDIKDPDISVIQVLRLLIVTSIFPQLILLMME